MMIQFILFYIRYIYCLVNKNNDFDNKYSENKKIALTGDNIYCWYDNKSFAFDYNNINITNPLEDVKIDNNFVDAKGIQKILFILIIIIIY